MNYHSTDACVICDDNLSCILLDCGHRNLCAACWDYLKGKARNGLPKCPTCRRETNGNECLVQLVPQPLSSILDNAVEGAVFAIENNTRKPTSLHPQLIASVRNRLNSIGAGTLTADNLRDFFRNNLTPAQISIAILELVKDANIHDIIIKHFQKEYQYAISRKNINDWEETARLLVKNIFSVENHISYLAVRATAAQVIDSTVTSLAGNAAKNNAISNALVGAMFCAVELYRWSNNEITGSQLSANVAEHIAGATASFGGEILGTAIATSLCLGTGSSFLVVLFSGTLFGAFGRATIRGLLNKLVESGVQDSKKEYLEQVNELARGMKIDITRDTYRDAKTKYRRCLMLCHPDKIQPSLPDIIEQKKIETAQLIASWKIIRKFYEENDLLESNLPPEEEDIFIKVYVMKIFNAATNAWEIVRTYVGNFEFQTREGVRVEEMTLVV